MHAKVAFGAIAFLLVGLPGSRLELAAQGCYDTDPRPDVVRRCPGGGQCQTQTCDFCPQCNTNCYCDQIGLCPCDVWIRQNQCWYNHCGGGIWVRNLGASEPTLELAACMPGAIKKTRFDSTPNEAPRRR